MTRVKRGFVARKRRKKIFKFTKGFVGSHSKLFRTANEQYMKSLRYSFRDRRKKKGEMKKIWISRINSIGKKLNVSYSKFMFIIKKSSINLNKKVLSKISLIDENTIKNILIS